MDLLVALVLRVLHFIYALVSLAYSLWSRQTRSLPQPLRSPRRRVPNNLAVVFICDPNIPQNVSEKTILESSLSTVEWCRAVGIPNLTLYEEHGLVLSLESQIREGVFDQSLETPSSDSDNEYHPLTPPTSIYSDSRQLSPCHSVDDVTNMITLKYPSLPSDQTTEEISSMALSAQEPISLHLLSRNSSKIAIANVARSLYVDHQRKLGRNGQGQRVKATVNFSLTMDTVNSLLENDSGLSSPDLMIIHPINPLQYNRTPPELHCFPPWHIRLTEIHLDHNQDKPRGWRHWLGSRLTYTPNPTVLDEVCFRDALDQFAAAEMRFGK